MAITRSHVFTGLIILFLLFVATLIPQDNTYIDYGMDNNDSRDNSTDRNQPDDQSPLMSTPENVVSDEKGWWKHEGHSTVTGGNLSASDVTSSIGNGIIDEDEGEGTGEENDGNGEEDEGDGTENEIPEFPNVTIPMVAVLVLALSFRKK